MAAGAILTMLSDTMMPEAVGHGGAEVGLVTVLGFASRIPVVYHWLMDAPGERSHSTPPGSPD